MYSQNYSLNSQLKIWMITLLVMIVLIILVGGLTRLTDSGLSITSWELFIGSLPPLTNDKWIEYFDLYKTIPEFKEQNFNMTLNEFKIIFWWEWAHRQLGRLIGLTVLFPMIYFTIKNGFWILKEYSIIFFLVCFQGFIGWYMVSSGLVDRVDVSHYRLSLHLFIAFIILSLVFWKFLKLTNIRINQINIKLNLIKFFLLLLFLQLIIGAFVSGMDAGKIYNTWPLMGSSYFPDDSEINDFLNLTVFDDHNIFLHALFCFKKWKYKFKNSNLHYWNFFIVSNCFGSSYNFIWSKNDLCISTPDKFYFNNTFNFVFSLYYKI